MGWIKSAKAFSFHSGGQTTSSCWVGHPRSQKFLFALDGQSLKKVHKKYIYLGFGNKFWLVIKLRQWAMTFSFGPWTIFCLISIFGIGNTHLYKLPLEDQANVENQRKAPLAITRVAVRFNPLISGCRPLPRAATFLFYLNLVTWAEIPTERIIVVPVSWSLKVS